MKKVFFCELRKLLVDWVDFDIVVIYYVYGYDLICIYD